jgi:hypothetical protein
MQQAKTKNAHMGLIIVVGTLTILMLILLVAVGLFLFNTQLSSAPSAGVNVLTGRTPLGVINPGEIDPALALASLGGVAEVDVIVEAIQKSRAETALAALLYRPTIHDKESAGDFLLLAKAYLSNGNQDKGIFCLQMAGVIAILSPNLPDTARTDILLETGGKLVDLKQPIWAKFYLDQAFLLAARSPFLQAIHRRSIFEQLQKDYLALNERELARKSLDLTAKPIDTTIGTEDQNIVLPQTFGAVVMPLDMQETEAERWHKAQELAALLVDRGGKAPQPAIEALKQALIIEDGQKIPFYQNELATASHISRKIDVAMAQIEWLSTKYRIARQAYGLTIVPEWEAQAEQIRADLTKTYETLFTLYADLIVALPEVSQIDKATEEKLRREILAGELGRYPNYPEEQRRKQLLDASNQLITTQPQLNIFIGAGEVAGQPVFRLISAEPVEP